MVTNIFLTKKNPIENKNKNFWARQPVYKQNRNKQKGQLIENEHRVLNMEEQIAHLYLDRWATVEGFHTKAWTKKFFFVIILTFLLREVL
jgi:hypothetical protein